MKLAYVLAQDPLQFRGGTEVIAWAQALAFAERGHDVRLVVPAVDASHTGFELVDGLEILRLAPPALSSPTSFIDERAREAVLHATRGADVVHLHHWYAASLDLARAVSRERVVVLQLHDAFSVCPRSFRVAPSGAQCPRGGELDPCVRCLKPDLAHLPEGGIRALLEERREHLLAEFEAADAVVAPSWFLAQLVARELGVPAPLVVPHGLCHEPSEFPPAPEREVGGPLQLLHAGNRTSVKGCLELAEAVAALPAGSVQLRFVGREVEPGVDAQLRSIGGAKVVVEDGYNAGDWPRLAAEHDLCLLPSRAAESYGLVAEEALASGLPTWVSDRGALPERVEEAASCHPDAGRVLPAESPDAWRKALVRLVEFPDRLQDARRLLPPAGRSARTSALDLELIDHSVLAARDRTTLRSA